MGVKIAKHSFYKSQPKSFQTSPEFSNGPLKTTVGIFELLSFRFLTVFFNNFKFTSVPNGEIQNLNYLENERS